MKKLFTLLVLIAISSCAKKQDKPTEESCSSDVKNTKSSKFKMYEMSEMSALMEQMYVDNQRLKQRILKGDTIGSFPNHFLKIHKAVMTDPNENDTFFKEQAANFIKAQELIYKDPKNAKQHFNEGVNACIQCHEVKCGGPIQRIKKLYIP
jgi:cytochrome c553